MTTQNKPAARPRQLTYEERTARFRSKDVLQRFYSKIEVGKSEVCWPWKAGLVGIGGYGGISIDGVKWRAHRIVYELHVGPIPEGLHVLHSCDNPRCVNPAHLRLGTNADNTQDRLLRNRQPRTVGESNGNAKLTDAERDEILERAARGEAGSSIHRNGFAHVSNVTVYNIIKGRFRVPGRTSYAPRKEATHGN